MSTESSPLLGEPPVEPPKSALQPPCLRDIIIGFADGLTVPFALTAGLSSLGSSKLVIMGGLAELFSGMISMGLGAYLAGITERDTQASRRRRYTARGVGERRADVHSVMERYALSRKCVSLLAEELSRDGERWARFMTEIGGGLEDGPGSGRAWVSGLTMGVSYFLGGLIPMIPYFLIGEVARALGVSVAVTVVVLLGFGYGKNYVAVRDHGAGVWGAVQTLLIGVLAAGTSYLIVKALDGGS